MRIVGIVVLVLGGVAALALWVIPPQGKVLGVSGGCGPPIIRVISSNNSGSDSLRRLVTYCKHHSTSRVLIGFVVALLAGASGTLFLLADRRSARTPAAPAP